MKITTKSGTVYRIEDGFWQRNKEALNRLSVFKSIPEGAETWGDLHESDIPAPQIGFCMYLSNKDSWQVSTPVVSIEDDE
jgi:hypothetical protein